MERILLWLRAHRAGAAAVLAVLLALAGGTVALVVDVDGPDGPTPPRTITIAVNATPQAPAPERTIAVPERAVEQVERSEVGDHVDARDETPDGVPAEQLKAAAEQRERIRESVPPLPTAGASAGFAGCRTSFISSYSSRGGVRPIAQVIHYTVSPNRPGWSDVDAIVAYFARASTGASSHFVIDREGNCAYIVPIEWKAWTQATGNPVSVSYEIINTGSEAPFMESAGYAKLRSVMRQVAERTGIPLRRGAVSGCTVTRSGILNHNDGGACWGGHHDIRPFSIDEVVALVSVPDPKPSPLTTVEQRIVRGVTRPAGTGHSRRYWCQRAVDRKALLLKLGRTDGWRLNRGARYQMIAKPWGQHCR